MPLFLLAVYLTLQYQRGVDGFIQSVVDDCIETGHTWRHTWDLACDPSPSCHPLLSDDRNEPFSCGNDKTDTVNLELNLEAGNQCQDSFAALIWASLKNLRNPEVYQQHFILLWNGQTQVRDCYFCAHGIFRFFPSSVLGSDLKPCRAFSFSLAAIHIPDICSM